MRKSLMEMTVKEFREEFRREYEELYKLHHEEFRREANKKNTKYTVCSKLIESTLWGKAHWNITPKDAKGGAQQGTPINLLFFLILIGIDFDLSNGKTICKYKNTQVGDQEFGDIFGKKGSLTVHRSLKNTFKIGTKNGNDEEIKILIENIISKISNVILVNPEISVEQFANEYKELCEKENIPDKYLKYFTGDKLKDSYLEKLEEEKNKMDRTYVEIKNEIKENIEAGVKQIILTGAPGTGKSRMAREIAEELSAKSDLDLKNLKEKLDGDPENENVKKELKKKFQEYIEFVQFHPSYDYTDFVEGIRPVEEPDKDGVGFRKVNGIFKQFCQQVVEKNEEEKNEEKKYFFIIDEINRADLSKVFGELMYCLESDKRGDQFEIKTQYQNMKTYKYETEKDNATGKYKIVPMENDKFGAGFFIPKNVYIIGTMNDIDRSVESMDFALRRRFMWKEIEVTQDLLIETLGKLFEEYNNNQSNAGNKLDANELAKKIESLNETIRIKGKDFGLNEHYFISQGQFANLPQHSQFDSQDDTEKIVKKVCQYVWNNRLKSLLFEYVRGEDGAADFVKTCAKEFGVSNE